MTYLIGLDVGTTGIKAVLADSAGKIIATEFVEYPLYFPQPAWAEQNPDDWHQAALRSLAGLVRQSGVRPAAVGGISFSGQMHGLVCLDANYKVLRPAILWCDQRTAAECRYITKKIGFSNLMKHVGNPALEGFTLPKLLWIKRHEPDVFARTRLILLPKDYVRFRLTGDIGIDESDAAGTIMMDLERRQWAAPILKAFGIKPSILPPIREATARAGQGLGREAAAKTGLPVGTPVIYGGADNAVAAVANGLITPGLVAVSIGTSGTVIAPVKTARKDPRGRVHTFNHAVPGLWYLMGVMQAAGLSLKWFRDNFGAEERAAERKGGGDAYDLLIQKAAQVPPGAEGLVWLPYLQGERTPHGDANARGVLFGLSARHTRAHVIRAIIEGVSFGLRDSVEILRELGVPMTEIRITGGGAKSAFWRQMLADILQHEVVSIAPQQGPAFGAALIAGVGVGVYKSFEDCTRKIITVEHRSQPDRSKAPIYDKMYAIYTSLYPRLKKVYKEAVR
ncbi:MAG: xylulokinase [Candidatus Sumerlaeia bacterium]